MAQRTKVRTPRGIVCGWPSVQSPDTKFAKPGEPGLYRANIRVPAEEAVPLQTRLLEELDKFKAHTSVVGPVNLPWEEELDENEEPTGNVIFKTKQTAWIALKDGSKVDMRVRCFDAQGVPMGTKNEEGHLESPNVGPGTEAIVAAEVHCWNVNKKVGHGVTLYFRAMQIFDLVERTDHDSADAYGFEVETFDEVAADSGEGF